MTEFNQQHNRVVWIDVPVADLERASAFYRAVLAIEVVPQEFGDVQFAVLSHDQGNGGCLVIKPHEVAKDGGILVYFDVEGRIEDAVEAVKANGGEVIQDTHPIGPHGFRALVLDSEGNRLALHSMAGKTP